mgnify:CR=1 FL=1
MSDIKMRLDKVRALIQKTELLEEKEQATKRTSEFSVMNRRTKWLSAICQSVGN